MRSTLIAATAAALAGCTIGSTDPPPATSPAATLAVKAAAIAEQTHAVEALAAELTSLVDESRRQVDRGDSTKDVEVEKMRAIAAKLTAENDDLQAMVADLEAEVIAAVQ